MKDTELNDAIEAAEDAQLGCECGDQDDSEAKEGTKPLAKPEIKPTYTGSSNSTAAKMDSKAI